MMLIDEASGCYACRLSGIVFTCGENLLWVECSVRTSPNGMVFLVLYDGI